MLVVYAVYFIAMVGTSSAPMRVIVKSCDCFNTNQYMHFSRMRPHKATLYPHYIPLDANTTLINHERKYVVTCLLFIVYIS